MNIAVFISGGGTTLNAIAEAIESGRLKSRIVLVITTKEEAGGIGKYVKPRNIPYEVINRKNFASDEEFGQTLVDTCKKYGVDFICLAGFLQRIPTNVTAEFKGRIINSHPGDTKRYGGEGMYGKFVHQAVLAAGEKETMSTIHWVDEIYDSGEVISQIKMPITADIKTAEELAIKLLPIEWENYVATLEKIEKGL
ncbi:MAG TPA: formyltransferase family protein [Patescibacteria group bacterium]|nr:formyltransferase family protein [Patescibacteria group bacterium]